MERNQLTKRSNQELFLELTFKPVNFLYILDILFRIVLAILFFSNIINTWLFIIPFFSITVLQAIIRSNIESKYIKKAKSIIPPDLINDFSGIKINYRGIEKILPIYVFIGIAISFWFFLKIIEPEHWYTYILVFFLGTIGLSSMIIIPTIILFPRSFDPIEFRVMKSVYNNRKNQKISIESPEVSIDVSSQYKKTISQIEKIFNTEISIEEIDLNDSEIARLESNLKNINTKVESYMLESVLLGALTFSGFLAIIVSEKTLYTSPFIRNLWLEIVSLFSSHSIDVFFEKIVAFSVPSNLLFLVMLESLFCSTFFILILGLRMRFSSLSLKLDYLIRIMTIFNAKEEELINIELESNETSEALRKRKEKISYKISEAITDANKLFKDISPIARLMGWYRNIGLVLFFIILITSGFFLSPQVSAAILVIAIFTWLFRVIETNIKVNKINKLIGRH